MLNATDRTLLAEGVGVVSTDTQRTSELGTTRSHIYYHIESDHYRIEYDNYQIECGNCQIEFDNRNL